MLINKGLLIRNVDSVSMCLCYFVIFFPLLEMLENFEGMFDSIKMLLIVLYFLVFLNALPAIYKGIKRQGILFYLFFVILAILYYDWISKVPYHIEMKDYVKLVNIHLFRYCIPMFLLGISINDIDRLLNYLKITAISLLIIYAFQYFLFSSIFEWVSYDQEAGYLCATSAIVFWVRYLTKKDYFCLFLLPLSFLFILLSGSRGPLLTVFLGLLLSLFVANKIKVRNLIPLCFYLVLIAILWFLLKDIILEYLIDFAEENGLSTRTFEKLSSNEMSGDDSREKLKSLAIGYSVEKFPYGSGILNDRIYIYTKHYASVSANSDIFGSYCHNYFIELLMQYGLIVGTLLGLYTLFIFGKKVFSKNSHLRCKLTLALFLTIGFFPLLVSRSYLTFPLFYLLLGFCFSYKHVNKIENRI